ncbi:hypothetical protein ACU4GA_16575 [Methylobacterium oryzae CBMB20]
MRIRPGTALLASLTLGLPTTAVAEAPGQPPTVAPSTDRASAPVSWPPNFSRNVQGTGVPGLDGGHIFLWNRPQGFDPVSTLRVDRHVPEGSGEATHTYKALWALGSTGPHNAGYEWTITGELHNRALASTGAQNVAVNGTIFKESNGLGPVGPSWAGNFNCVDMTDEADPVASCIGAEIDVSAQSPTTDRNRQRVGLQISTGGVPGAHTGYGIPMGNLTGSITDRAISFQGGGHLRHRDRCRRRAVHRRPDAARGRAGDRARRRPRGRLLPQPRLRRARSCLRHGGRAGRARER